MGCNLFCWLYHYNIGFMMKNIYKIMLVSAVCGVLYGCVVVPGGEEFHDARYSKEAGNHSHYITHDGITLPPCDEIPDASQADNGQRCWFE